MNSRQLNLLKDLIDGNNSFNNYSVQSFEMLFSRKIGNGNGVSFASARMAFYSLLTILDIGKGDEIIIQAGNCSVMINAILRRGAVPIYVDFDLNTFGSNAKYINGKISKKTKMIVAQHSFGIPCEVDKIVKIAKKNNIFLLEDCALSFDSKINNISVGNWGDAAIFSTDKTKPINTLIGGILYSNDNKITNKVIKFRDQLPELSQEHQRNLYSRLLFERFFFNPRLINLGFALEYFQVVFSKLFNRKEKLIFLVDDCFNPNQFNNTRYPYPAKMPSFLAQLGIFELERWEFEKIKRKNLLKNYVDIFVKNGLKDVLPVCYFNSSLEIVPLRFVFNLFCNEYFKRNLEHNFDINSSWFLKPIVACFNPSDFGYISGMCKNVEYSNNNILNFPCVVDHKYDQLILITLNKNIIKSGLIRNLTKKRK